MSGGTCDKAYNKRVLIWYFTLVLIKINYGQIGDQTGLFYTRNPVFYTIKTLLLYALSHVPPDML
jgi:hypothetical protein